MQTTTLRIMHAPASNSARAIGLLQFLHEAPMELLRAQGSYALICALGAQDLIRHQPTQRHHGILPFRTSSIRCYQCGAQHGNTAGLYTPYVFACADCDEVGYSAAWSAWHSMLWCLCNHVSADGN